MFSTSKENKKEVMYIYKPYVCYLAKIKKKQNKKFIRLRLQPLLNFPKAPGSKLRTLMSNNTFGHCLIITPLNYGEVGY